MMQPISDYANWHDSLHDLPAPEPDEHQVRFYSHDYTADTSLIYDRRGSRSELTLTFSSEDPDMGSEEMVYGGDSAESMAELVSELKQEITAYLDAADTSSFASQQGLPQMAASPYDEYSRTALYAFEAILSETERDLRKEIIWKPIEKDQRAWLYSGGATADFERGCIGHLRGDFGKSGTEFWTSWFDHRAELKNEAFHSELQDVVNDLHKPGGLLRSFASMSRECRDGTPCENSFGFRAESPNYTYCLRCNPQRGDYNFYLYAYEKNAQREHERNQKAQRDEKSAQGKPHKTHIKKTEMER